MSKTWTEERTEEVERLWKMGLTADEVAERMGLTRNAVCGKLNRMGLMGRMHHRIRVRTNRSKYTGSTHGLSWDEKLFEPYSVRKARLERERAQ